MNSTTDSIDRDVAAAAEQDLAYRVALKYLGDSEDARDAAQDALLLAVRHRGSFRGDSAFTTWLYRIAATAALMHVRKRKRNRVFLATASDADIFASVRSGEPSPEDLCVARETAASCQRELDRLGDRYREVFHLRFLEGYTESEIAARLGIKSSTVKTRAFRAARRMRRELAPVVAA